MSNPSFCTFTWHEALYSLSLIKYLGQVSANSWYVTCVVLENSWHDFKQRSLHELILVSSSMNGRLCIDEEVLIYIADFSNYLSQMYPFWFEIKDTTESNTSFFTSIYSCRWGRTVNFTFPYKRDDFKFHKLSVPVKYMLYSSFASLWRSHSVYHMPG